MFSPSSLFDLFCENERKGGNKTKQKKKEKAQKIKTLFLRDWQIGKLKKLTQRWECSTVPAWGGDPAAGTPPRNGGSCSWRMGKCNESFKETAPRRSSAFAFIYIARHKETSLPIFRGSLAQSHNFIFLIVMHAPPSVRGCTAWCNFYRALMCTVTMS